MALLPLALLACETSGSTPDAKVAAATTDGESLAPAAGTCTLDLDKLVPIASTVHLSRYPDSRAEFAATAACGEQAGLKAYWFVDFDVYAPKIWASEAEPFVLKACDLTGDYHVVEALVTAGQLEISVTDAGDPRHTLAGEPITLLRWFVTVDGDQSGCATSPGQ